MVTKGVFAIGGQSLPKEGRLAAATKRSNGPQWWRLAMFEYATEYLRLALYSRISGRQQGSLGTYDWPCIPGFLGASLAAWVPFTSGKGRSDK